MISFFFCESDFCALFCFFFFFQKNPIPPPNPPPPTDRLPQDRPKFRSFLSLSRHNFHSLLPSLFVFSWNFGGVFEGRDPLMKGPGLFFTTTARERRKNENGSGRGGKKREILATPTLPGPTPLSRPLRRPGHPKTHPTLKSKSGQNLVLAKLGAGQTW